MRARAIQVIDSQERRYFPGEFLDDLSPKVIEGYVEDGLAAWFKEGADIPKPRKRKGGQGEDEVKDGNG
jgi:hypothetical protein